MEKGMSEAFFAYDKNKDKLYEHEIQMQQRIMLFLGNQDLAKGRQIWIDKEYPDIFYRLLEEDSEFEEQVRLDNIAMVLNMLEQKELKLAQDREAADQVLLRELEAFKQEQLADKITLVGFVALSIMGAHSFKSIEKPRPQPVSVYYDELKKLDSEATPERINALLATFPEGLIREVRSIDFINEKYVIDPEYGTELSERFQGVATAEGGAGKAGTEIVFWRAMKGPTYEIGILSKEKIVLTKENMWSREIWSATLAHEVSHAGDWLRSSTLSEFERIALEKAVYDRVRSKDRYVSAYVEAIANEDKEVELQKKATEYWAEIGKAYFDGEANLPDADFKLVDEHIKKIDPNFDRDKALQKRLAITRAMNAEQAHAQFKNQSSLAKK